jgi:hypothetical protein
MGLESVRAVILFAAGDPEFRSRLIADRQGALAGFDLSLDDAMILDSVRFTKSSIAFEDGELLERLIGEGAAGDGFSGFALPGWFAPPPEFGSDTWGR